MRKILPLCLMLTGCVTTIPNIPHLEVPKEIDFRGAFLGASPLNNMVIEPQPKPLGISDSEILETYHIPGESKYIGGRATDIMQYEYYNDKLFRVMIFFKETEIRKCANASNIISSLEDRYKINFKVNSYMIEYQQHVQAIWNDRNSQIFYTCDPKLEGITFENISLKNEVKHIFEKHKISIEQKKSKRTAQDF